jgi:hypothetical protein
MKRWKIFLFQVLFGLFFTLAAGQAAHADNSPPATIELDGNVLTFMEHFEYIFAGDRLLVSAPELFAALGANVEHDPAWQNMTATKDNHTLQLQAGKNTACLDGKKVALEHSPRPGKGGMLVPLRFVSESLGAKVEWYADSRTVVIMNKAKNLGIVDKELLPLAAKGLVKGIPFPLGTERNQIEKLVGSPTDSNMFEGGSFFYYPPCDCAVLYDEQNHAAILWLFPQKIGNLRTQDVRKVLGKPEWEEESQTHVMYLLYYPAGPHAITFHATFKDGTVNGLWLEKKRS